MFFPTNFPKLLCPRKVGIHFEWSLPLKLGSEVCNIIIADHDHRFAWIICCLFDGTHLYYIKQWSKHIVYAFEVFRQPAVFMDVAGQCVPREGRHGKGYSGQTVSRRLRCSILSLARVVLLWSYPFDIIGFIPMFIHPFVIWKNDFWWNCVFI